MCTAMASVTAESTSDEHHTRPSWPRTPRTHRRRRPRPAGTTAHGRQRFDAIALRIVRDLDRRWNTRLGLVEYAVEDVPPVNEVWTDAVPLAALVRGSGPRPTRLIFYRRPIEHRCSSADDVEDLVLMVACEQVAELLGVDPHEVHPHYQSDL